MLAVFHSWVTYKHNQLIFKGWPGQDGKNLITKKKQQISENKLSYFILTHFSYFIWDFIKLFIESYDSVLIEEIDSSPFMS